VDRFCFANLLPSNSETSPMTGEAEMPPADPLAGHPATIGPYRITGLLGAGGMGVVYAAEQTEPVRRRVAIKLIRGVGAEQEEVTTRFAAERQALAVMEHPGIAKVYDAGTTADGEAYFVMEYLEGTPITEWCDTHAASTAERLGLFIAVCDAIQHAHQKGIIHRDLKPGNILVTEQAGSPLPKVIDFGIAKAIDLRLGEQSLVTQHGQIIGTPAYMAPEQADSDGVDIDTRADVYALGVILYELLVGRLPLDPQELGFLPFLAKLVMRQTNPPTPSARLSTLAGEVDVIAQQRHTDSGQLRRQVSGDLDWVTMKAIEPERERRYATASALGDDLGRHLRDEPVAARPPSTAYKMEKFVRRNRGAVLAGVLALLALVGGTITTAVGLVRAQREEARANREAATAGAVSDFLVDLFRSAQPSFEAGGGLTARDLIDHGVERVDSQLAGQPEIQARILATLGGAYHGLGFYDAAEGLHRRALEAAESVFGPEDPDLARYLYGLADAIPYNSPDGSRAGGTERRELAERALAILRTDVRHDTLDLFGSLTQVAWSQHASGALDSALAKLDSASAVFDGALPPASQFRLGLRRAKAHLLINADRDDEAIEVLEQLLADSLLPSPFWEGDRITGLRNDLTLAYSNVGRHDEAVTIFEANYRAMSEVGDSSTHRDYEQLSWNLAQQYAEMGEFDRAIAIWDQVVHRVATIHPEDPTAANGYRVRRAATEAMAGRFRSLRFHLDTVIPLVIAAADDPRVGARGRGDLEYAAWTLGRWIVGTGAWPRAVSIVGAEFGADTGLMRAGLRGAAEGAADAAQWDAVESAVRQEMSLIPKAEDALRHLAWWQAIYLPTDRERFIEVISQQARIIARSGVVALGQEAARGDTVDNQQWNRLCWSGALAGAAEVVLPACDRAVAEADSANRPRNHDSRGVARALAGDLSGAADDFAAYVAAPLIQAQGESAMVKQRGWVTELRAGRNPFTLELLDQLRGG
jgi:serine/threonine protein kinase/tetratricopeptide (TPR) repeat protein